MKMFVWDVSYSTEKGGGKGLQWYLLSVLWSDRVFKLQVILKFVPLLAGKQGKHVPVVAHQTSLMSVTIAKLFE